DRIIVGETRRQREAEVMFEAMHTGHSVYTTFHANTAEETIRRMVNPPISIPSTVLDSVHLNVVMFRNRRLGVRRVLQVAEFVPEKRGTEETLKANTLYRWRAIDDTISKDSESIRLYDELSLHTGLTYDEIEKDLEDKKNILEWMVRQDIHNINDVGKVMAHYYLDSDSIVKIAKRNERPDFL
ncbi:MAG: ATPase, T2SS/T4P/T4SS family, partial [Candidatus Diapherotrites archaeon]